MKFGSKLFTNLSIYFSAFVGAIIAVLADLVQKKEASATKSITNALREFFNFSLDNTFTLVLLTLISISLCFIYEVKTKKVGFYLGASILALIMTSVPYQDKSGSTIPKTNDESNQAKTIHFDNISNKLSLYLKQHKSYGTVSLEIIDRDDSNRKIQINQGTVYLLNPNNRSIIKTFNIRTNKFSFNIETGNYILLVQVPTYSSNEQQILVKSGTTKSLKINLKKIRFPFVGEALDRLLRF